MKVLKNIKESLKISSIPVVAASLCCLAPLILALAGLATVSFAASLTDVFYGQYAWWFRLVGLLFLALAIIFYLRRAKGICTIDEAKKRKNEIINIVLLTLIIGIIGYLIFLYVIVHYAGVFFGLW